ATDNVLTREEATDPGFVDEDDQRRASIVAFADVASLVHGDPHGTEISGRDLAQLVVRTWIAGPELLTFDRVAPVAHSLDRRAGDRAGGVGPRHGRPPR